MKHAYTQHSYKKAGQGPGGGGGGVKNAYELLNLRAL